MSTLLRRSVDGWQGVRADGLRRGRYASTHTLTAIPWQIGWKPRQDGRTALHVAAALGRAGIVDVLLREQAINMAPRDRVRACVRATLRRGGAASSCAACRLCLCLCRAGTRPCSWRRAWAAKTRPPSSQAQTTRPHPSGQAQRARRGCGRTSHGPTRRGTATCSALRSSNASSSCCLTGHPRSQACCWRRGMRPCWGSWAFPGRWSGRWRRPWGCCGLPASCRKRGGEVEEQGRPPPWLDRRQSCAFPRPSSRLQAGGEGEAGGERCPVSPRSPG